LKQILMTFGSKVLTVFMNREINDRLAFTLIELLIVILLLGILAMVTIPNIFVSIEEAKLNTLKSILNAERRAIER